ncbi:DUF3817 domain-containing protein [Streptomyces thermolineatus]|uniref:DUF3817 domain-containing protein n=1 Tax=Streptomyces thermolineatus TaxID=44033 RepID=A0ABN3KVD3_9ACTN
MDVKTASAVRRFRLVSFVEAVSFVVLLAASVLKRTTDFNAVPVLGAVHGFLFVLFCLFLLDAWNRTKWSLGRPVLYFVLSVIPFAGFYAERLLKAEEERWVAAAHGRKAQEVPGDRDEQAVGA